MKQLHRLKLASLFVALTIGINLLPAGATTVESPSAESKIAPLLQKAMAELPTGEKLPVYLWTQDIDHEQAERQVKIRTGLTIDSIQLNVKKQLNMSELDISFAETNDEVKAKEQMSVILKNTEAVREQKRVLTDTYIAEKRSAYQAEYRSKNGKSRKALHIEEKDVLFQSEYSPMIIANLSAEEMTSAAQSPAVTTIGLCEEATVINDSLASSMQSIEADLSVSLLTGSGVKIGQLERGVPDTSDSGLGGKVTAVGGSVDSHATRVARVLHAMAPDAQIYSIGLGTDGSLSNFCSKVEQLIGNCGVSVINMSAGITTDTGERVSSTDPWYSPYEQWVDHISGTHEVTFVVAAGNNGIGQDISIPGLAHNVITVGAIDDNNTGSVLTDDYLWPNTSTSNGNQDGCAKPDVMAPGTNEFSYDDQGNRIQYKGTSSAAPIVVGLAAQMMEYDSSLKGRARLVKAILSACCDRKVSNTQGGGTETMEQGLTAEQGAGVVNAMCTILINESDLSGYFTGSSYTATISLSSPCNVSATWLRENTLTYHTSGAVTTALYQNLDLYLYRSNGTLLSSSCFNIEFYRDD